MNPSRRVSLITLGCSKNLVDSEYLLQQLKHNGFQPFHEQVREQDILIINTCGFIKDAKEESIETILEYAQQRKNGKIHKLLVMGCLSQRYREELKKEIPEVDRFFGVDEQRELIEYLNVPFHQAYEHQRLLSGPGHYAYLKIAEGCNRKCAFCSIPFIRGSFHSKPIDGLLKESEYLNENGVKEINLIAQDLSRYGADLYGRPTLPELLRKLAENSGFDWIRMLYAYPSDFPEESLQVMKDYDTICDYLDMPFQHISDAVLKKMRRGHSLKSNYNLIELIKKEIPSITLRTTLMVGHPGESEEDFRQLLDFVKSVRFDRLGVFAYSEEEGTYGARHYEDRIPASVKQERAEEIMRVQQKISHELNQEKVGSVYKTLIDAEDEHHYYGRTESDAPEVDNALIIPKKGNRELVIGEFYQVKVTGASEFDLHGSV